MCLSRPSAPALPPPPPPPPEPARDVVTPRTTDRTKKNRTLAGATGQNRTLLGGATTSNQGGTSLLGT